MHLASTTVLSLILLAGCSSAQSDLPREDALQRDASHDAALASDAPVDGGVDANTFFDSRDGQTYPTIKFGATTWLARNLNFEIAGSSFCYDDVATHCARDGRLYSWSVAMAACPSAWHLATDADWKALERALGMPASDLDLEGYSTVRGTGEGTTLKDAAGFGATMAGYRTGTSYEARGDRTYYWTASKRSGDVWRRRISAADPTVFRFTNAPSTFAISIRCVKD